MADEIVVEIYTDGACSPNPGPGGWGAVLKYGGHERDLYGGEPSTTTNNRMELMAPIQALESLSRRSTVRIYTDSTYVRNGITGWLANWKRNGWLTGAKQPVKNEDLWRRLEEATDQHDVEWHWVKGHAGHPENERADRLAVKGAQEASPPKARKPKEKRPKIEIVGDCRATTKAGKRCPIGAGESGFCHVHDPALQCGGTKKNGQRCGVATGGGRCAVHR